MTIDNFTNKSFDEQLEIIKEDVFSSKDILIRILRSLHGEHPDIESGNLHTIALAVEQSVKELARTNNGHYNLCLYFQKKYGLSENELIELYRQVNPPKEIEVQQ